MNGFEDLLRRDLQASGLRNAFVVDVDPVVASGHRTIRRRVLTTSALGLVAVVAVVGGLVFRPGAVPPVAEPAPSVVASPSPAPTTSDGFAPSDPTPEPSATLDVARWATPSVDFASPSTRLACAMRPDGVTCAIPMEFTGTVPEVDCVDGPGPATEVDRTGYNTRDYYWLAGAGQVVVRVERSEERVVDLEVWHAPGSLPDG